MNQKDRSAIRPGHTAWQWIITVFLIGFPLLMILFNITRAIKGITWKMPEAIQSSLVLNKQQNNDQAPLIKERKSVIAFGIYDPEKKFTGNRNFGLEQIFCSWITVDAAALREKINGIYLNNRIPVITIEPWNRANNENTLMVDIVKGKYDENLNRIITVLAGFPGKFYLSWGHEMDQDLTKRYPWSGTDPGSYIRAYRYVVDKFRKNLDNKISWIWSPVAKQGCERYWPGPEFVDFIGIPVYSYPAWDKQYYGHIRSFKSWYDEKYKLIKRFKKPVIIVELGVTGSQDYQTFWLQEAFNELNVTPFVEMVLFFYAKDKQGSWGNNIETPDWRSNPEVITGLIQWIKRER